MNDTVITKLLWLIDLSDEDKLIEIKKDNELCSYVAMYSKNFNEECVEHCKVVWAFHEL